MTSNQSTGTPWDFAADLEALLARQGGAGAWRRWDELHEAAATVVAVARERDRAQLLAWLDENAETLVGQQLLVRSVHRERDAAGDVADALGRWSTTEGGAGDADDAVSWLQREEPALLRAWLLGHLPELVGHELTRMQTGQERARRTGGVQRSRSVD